MTTDIRPFRLSGPVPTAPVLRLLEQALGLGFLDRHYRQLPPSGDVVEFIDRVLDFFGIEAMAEPCPADAVPAEGGVIVVANHPFGGIEGLLLARWLLSVRPDAKVMTTAFLTRIPELAPLFIGVDNFGGRAAASRNLRPMREALRWVCDGHVLAAFPAGEVAAWKGGRVTDAAWQPQIGRLAQLSGAQVVPVWFEGRNSALFHAAGVLHSRLRTALLARELINKQGRRIEARFGRPLGAAKLEGLSPEEVTALLRLRTESLRRGPADAARSTAGTAIAAPEPATLLAAEVDALPAAQCLEPGEPLSVYWARAEQIPNLLQEVGRLREVTFRAAGEGTGQARDLDAYDGYYRHLFVWNRETREVVGAYRLGLSDTIRERFGRRGFYTHSLFRYRSALLDRLGPSIELGRSFVRPEYQRSYAPLLLLWKGIGRFVAAHPHYRVLFGPVSISNDYETASQQLMVEFLRAHRFDAELARHVRPRRPFRPAPGIPPLPLGDADRLSDLVAQIEGDGKGVPVLLRQYLKLGGRILGFNVDDGFADALDALIMVDLAVTESRVLTRYMGREAAERFLAHHQDRLPLAS